MLCFRYILTSAKYVSKEICCKVEAQYVSSVHRGDNFRFAQFSVKVKVKVSYLTSVAKQAKTAFLHGPTVCKSPIVGIEPATFRSEALH